MKFRSTSILELSLSLSPSNSLNSSQSDVASITPSSHLEQTPDNISQAAINLLGRPQINISKEKQMFASSYRETTGRISQ